MVSHGALTKTGANAAGQLQKGRAGDGSSVRSQGPLLPQGTINYID